ncbi:hypothetical protein ACFLXC_02580 [Chloroflexota bacterium]
MSDKRKYWIIGLLIAVIGVVLVRVVSGMYEDIVIKMSIYAVGVIIAFAGLAIILRGMKK